MSVNEYNPLVSIVIPCYNHQDYVQECIQSVIDQDYQNIELIIIDDGSSDNSVQKIEEMMDECNKRFVRFEFRHHPNKGLCETLNEALEWCGGVFFSPLASDDMIFANKTSIQVNYLIKNIRSAGVFGGVSIANDMGTKKIKTQKSKSFTFDDIFLHNHTLPAPTALLRLDLIKEIGGYPKDLIIEDWYLWLKITEKGYHLDYIDNIFSMYRRHEKNTSNQFKKMMSGRLQILKMFQSHKNYHNAVANAYLVSANDWLESNSNKSWFQYKQYVRFYKNKPKAIMHIKSIKYFVKVALKIVRNIFSSK